MRLGLSVILRLLSPVLPTITEEIWSWCFKDQYNINSIHQSDWPSSDEFSEYNNPKYKNSLEIAIRSIRSVRQTKTSEGVGLGKPVRKIKIQTNEYNLEVIESIIEDFSNASGCSNFVNEISDNDEISTEILEKESE